MVVAALVYKEKCLLSRQCYNPDSWDEFPRQESFLLCWEILNVLSFACGLRHSRLGKIIISYLCLCMYVAMVTQYPYTRSGMYKGMASMIECGSNISLLFLLYSALSWSGPLDLDVYISLVQSSSNQTVAPIFPTSPRRHRHPYFSPCLVSHECSVHCPIILANSVQCFLRADSYNLRIHAVCSVRVSL